MACSCTKTSTTSRGSSLRRSARISLALWTTSLSLAACGEAPRPDTTPTSTATASSTPAAADCVGAAARANAGCPEPDAVRDDTGARGAPCERTEPLGRVEPCAFGPQQADTTFALVGDSHAGQLRTAFAAAADELGWRGYALTRSGCPYVRDGRPLPEPTFGECAEWKAQVPDWLARHPEVKTVFVIGLPRNAANQDPANWTAAWERFPPSVERLVIVRDTPELAEDTLACVKAAEATPGTSCAVPREQALAPDPAVTAAEQRDAPTIDLTRFFCDDTRCFPVIGGVLAYQDITHVTPAFARTLGPFLAAEVRRLPS